MLLIISYADIAEVVDRTDDTNYVGLITQNTTVVEARGILGPSICSLFNCTASPNGGPPNADPELVPRLGEFKEHPPLPNRRYEIPRLTLLKLCSSIHRYCSRNEADTSP